MASSGLIPEQDATLLFANAGMNQFKNLFLGLENRPYQRAVSSQKCVRAGGKHNDLENVGFTARHHTFFEMLGNFSFGDYFKNDAIHFAWELLTKEFQIPKDRLYVTVFENDDEAAQIWHKQEGVPKDRIFRFGEKDNFWRMGDVGPCGPCTEIFFDHGAHAGHETDPYKGILAGEDRFVEIWNLVFMQFDEKSPGVLEKLPKPSVDTGSGLERVCAALQGKSNNYDTDLFWPLIETTARLSHQLPLLDSIHQLSQEGIRSKMSADIRKKISALRVVADHTRAVSFMLADGVLPSNEGRGYVLRRILRRGVRFCQLLSGEDAFLPEVAKVLIEQMGKIYPELSQRQSHILHVIEDEQRRFSQTLSHGLQSLEMEMEKLRKVNSTQVTGQTAFRLYDSAGFPVDLTQLIAAEQGFTVDMPEFERQMEAAKDRARASWKGQALSNHQSHLISWADTHKKKLKSNKAEAEIQTEFVGYESLVTTTKILALSDGTKDCAELAENETGYFLTEATPFYAESGGQVADLGEIKTEQGLGEIFDVQKQGNWFIHSVRVKTGTIKTGSIASLSVMPDVRRRTAAHHSATHLLHAALRKVLGSHVTQAGSLVDSKKLRFDFTHTGALSTQQIKTVEDLVNHQISQAIPVGTEIMTPAQASAAGALALFGEKYGDKVRVLKMGTFSMELCGGTHVRNTAEIRCFKIVSESGVSAGVRRIEALAADAALSYLNRHTAQNLATRSLLGIATGWEAFMEDTTDSPIGKGAAPDPATAIVELKAALKDYEKQMRTAQASTVSKEDLLSTAFLTPSKLGEVKCVFAVIPLEDRGILSSTADYLRDKLLPRSVVILVGGKSVVVSVSPEVSSSFSAGDILKALCAVAGGRGGGRPQFAQGAIETPSSLGKAFESVKQSLANSKP